MESAKPEATGSQTSKRLFAAGAVILLALNVFVTAIGADTSQGSAYLIGVLVGAVIVGIAVVIVMHGVARALGKARTGAAKAKIAFWTLAVLLFFNFANFANLVAEGRRTIQSSSSTAVTNSERAGLQIDADSIRHAELGFVLPHPGSSFTASPELQRQLEEGMSQQPSMVVWAFRDTVRRQALVIQLTKVNRADEKAFREFASGIRNGLAKAKVVEDTLSMQGAAGDYRLTVLHPVGLHIAMRCLPRARPAGSYIVCAQTTAVEPNALESSRAGLRFIE